MTLLRAVFVVIASWTAALGSKLPWAKRLNPVACENALSIKSLRTQPEIARYDLFLESFKPWRREGDEIVGRAGEWIEDEAGHPIVGEEGSVEWRVNPSAGRMTYSFRDRVGVHGQLISARRIAKAALAAFRQNESLERFSVEAREGRVVTRLPLTASGVAFVIDAFNESQAFSAFRPIEFDRAVSVAREVERDGCTHFEYDVHRELVVSACARQKTSAWLDGQDFLGLPRGSRFDAIAGEITIDLESPRGLRDVLANARRIGKYAVIFKRAGLETGATTEVLPNDVVRVKMPWSPVALDFRAVLEKIPNARRYDRPLVVNGLTALESAEVSRILDGLAPRVAYARSHPEHFLRARLSPPPTAAEEEIARRLRYPGETVPPEMRRNPAVQNNELLYSAFNPWRPAGDVWTANIEGVTLIFHPGNWTLDVDYEQRTDGLERASRVLLALLRRRGSVSLENVRVLDDGRRLEVPLGPVAARVLMETRESLSSRSIAPPSASELARLREWQSGAAPLEFEAVRAAAE